MVMAVSSLAMSMAQVIVIITGRDSTALLQSCQGQKDQNRSQVDHHGGGCLIKDITLSAWCAIQQTSHWRYFCCSAQHPLLLKSIRVLTRKRGG